MEQTCQHCGALFTAKHALFGRNKNLYCSQACANRAHAAPGKQNPNYKPKVEKICETCGKPYFVRPSSVQRSRFCSVLCRVGFTRTLTGDKRYNHKGKVLRTCEVCGTQKTVKPAHADRFRACSRRCASELARRTWPRTSKIEQIMGDAFAAAGLPVLAQYPISFYTVDFAFPESMLVVECDGDYWHGRPAQQKKDAQKDIHLKRLGWKIIRLRESEIHDSPSKCIDRVRPLI
jgi:very-short-patch-repair endonuclease